MPAHGAPPEVGAALALIGADSGNASTAAKARSFHVQQTAAKPDAVADKSLEHELMVLYVGLTRATSRLWLYESDAPLRGAPWTAGLHMPAWAYLQSRTAVEVVRPGNDVEPLL